jgi:hypothetical protein
MGAALAIGVVLMVWGVVGLAIPAWLTREAVWLTGIIIVSLVLAIASVLQALRRIEGELRRHNGLGPLDDTRQPRDDTRRSRATFRPGDHRQWKRGLGNPDDEPWGHRVG